MDTNAARRRKSKRVSIFIEKEDSDDEESPPKKPPDQDASPKKRTGSFSPRVSGGKGFSKPVMKKNKPTSIEFVPRDSELLGARIYKPSCTSVTWQFLREGIIEPKETTYEETYIYSLRSFAMYALHVILVFWVIYGSLDFESNYQSIIMLDLITQTTFETSYVLDSIKFDRIRAPQSIWDFIRGVVLKILYPIGTYNNSVSILQDNVMVGVAQLRQVRVKKDTCETDPMFKNLYKSCYGRFDEDAEDKEPYGMNSSRPWKYSINLEKKAKGTFRNYHGSGYALNFSQDYNWTADQLEELENNQWIRLGTRAVFLDFSLFCPNTNTFLIVKMTFEVMAWGGVYPTLHVYAVKLLTSLNDANAFLLLGVEIALLGYTLGLNYVLFLRLRRAGMKTLFTFDNLIDVAIISSTYATLGAHITLAQYTQQKLESIINMIHKSEHPTFGIIITIYDWYLTIVAILLLCNVLKVIRYFLHINETTKLLICALSKVKGELLLFTIMNMSILIGFSLVYCTVYGAVYRHLVNPVMCLGTLIFLHARAFRIYVDAINTGTIPDQAEVLLSIAVPLSVLYINCISQQTYVALIVHGWQQAVRDCSKQALQIKGYEITMTRIVQILEKLKLYRCANKLQEYYITQMNEDDYDPMIEIMRRYGWSHLEIRLLMRKYGIRRGDDLTIDELFEVYQDFWVRNTLYFEVNSHKQLKTDLEYTGKMIKYTESAISDLKLGIERLTDTFLDKQTMKKAAFREASVGSIASTPRKSLLGRLWK